MSLLPRERLLEGSRRRQELLPVLEAAEAALRTWEPQWTDLLEPALREEAEQRLDSLSELQCDSWGGHPGAERRRLLVQRRDVAQPRDSLDADLEGLEISGNFLFDPAEARDLRIGILAAAAMLDGETAAQARAGRQGSPLSAPMGSGAEGAIGDLWIRGDRGGQGIVRKDLASRLDGREGLVRSVPVRFQARPIGELQLPAQRLAKRLHTVEASLRLDAVGSAGFGISRSRMAERIRQGAVRIDWQVVTSPSRELAVGERVQLEGRGELTVEAVQATQRGRWRVELSRR